MSKQYDDTDRGVLFKNDKKARDNQPDYTGSINVGGAEFFLSGWIKRAESGRTYMSLSVQPKEQRGGKQQRRTEAPRMEEDPDIPF